MIDGLFLSDTNMAARLADRIHTIENFFSMAACLSILKGWKTEGDGARSDERPPSNWNLFQRNANQHLGATADEAIGFIQENPVLVVFFMMRSGHHFMDKIVHVVPSDREILIT